MGTSAPPAPAREAADPLVPAGTTAGTAAPPAASVADVIHAPKTVADAVAEARELLAKQTADGEGTTTGDGAPTGGEGEPTAEETPDEKAARETAEAELRGKLVVSGPGLRGDDGLDTPFEIEASDEESAQVLRTWVKGYQRGEQAKAVRAQGQQLLEQAEEIQLGVNLDPGGFVAKVIQEPADVDHLVRDLLTRDGVLERLAPWIGGLLDAPEAIKGERTMIEAEDIKRQKVVGEKVQVQRAITRNATQLVDTATNMIETTVPQAWSDEAKGQLYRDVMSDLQAFARANQLVTIDPKVLTGPKGLVARRLATYGVAVRSEGALVPAAGTAAPPKAVAPKTLTAEELVKNRRAKRAAASASPGAGSPVASLAKAPAYDPKQKGSPIEQAAAWGKAQLRRMTTRPQ